MLVNSGRQSELPIHVKILCIEDDEGLAVLLQHALVKQHYQVELATDGLTGWNLTETDTYDLILLDWILPKLTGIEFCQQLRTGQHSGHNPNRDTPILLMTALDTITNKVMGLNAGADDYVVKPFDLDELLARIRALLRRNQNGRSPLLQWGKVCLNPNSCEVTYQGQPIVLAAKEYELLELFLRNPDQIFSLNRLLAALWNVDEMPGEGTVRAHVKGLRQKLKQAGADDPIETIYKLGYRLKPQKVLEGGRGSGEDGGGGEGRGGGENGEGREGGEDKTNQASSPLSPPSPSSFVLPELWEAWQEVRSSYCDRLSIIQQAVTALHQQTLTLEQQQSAEREAHTLVGSLGSFGLEDASRISRHVQQILKQSQPLGQLDLEKLLPLVAALRWQLENSTKGQTTAIEVTEVMDAIAPSSSPPLPLLLVVDQDRPWAESLAHEAASWGMQTRIATNFRDAQQWLQNGGVEAMLLNLDDSTSRETGLEFLAAVRVQYPTLPVVTLAATGSFEQRLEAARLDTPCFLKRPIAPTKVLAAIVPVLQGFNPSTARILIVDDESEALQPLSTLLVPEGYQVSVLSEPQRFWETLEQAAPNLLILAADYYPPTISTSHQDQTAKSLSGIELCQMLRSDPHWNHLPVIFLSAHSDRETVQRCYTVGADDVLSKPVVPHDLLMRVRSHLEQRKRWELWSDRSSAIPSIITLRRNEP